MHRLINLSLDILAIVRLTKLILHDYITEDIRNYVFKHFPPAKSKLGYLFTCPWCMSIWVAALYIPLKRLNPQFATYLSELLTASLVTGVLNEKGII